MQMHFLELLYLTIYFYFFTQYIGDSTCMLWDVELGVSKLIFSDHEGDVMSVSILPSVDPNMFISG